MYFDPDRKLPIVVFIADKPGGVDVLDKDAGPPRRSKANASFLPPATTTRFPGYASSKACRFVPEPEASTAKREPSGSSSDKLYSPCLCDLPDSPGIATRLIQRFEPRRSLFGRHDSAETNAEVEDPAHLAFRHAA